MMIVPISVNCLEVKGCLKIVHWLQMRSSNIKKKGYVQDIERCDFTPTGDQCWLQHQVNDVQKGPLLPTTITSQFTCIDAEMVARIEARHTADLDMRITSDVIQRRADVRRKESSKLHSDSARREAAHADRHRVARLRQMEAGLARVVFGHAANSASAAK